MAFTARNMLPSFYDTNADLTPGAGYTMMDQELYLSRQSSSSPQSSQALHTHQLSQHQYQHLLQYKAYRELPRDDQLAPHEQALEQHHVQRPPVQPPPQSAVPCALERLPSELQRMIYCHLDYQSLIHLSTMNRYFHHMIDPQSMADPLDKAQFVMRAAKDFPQHRPSEKGHDYRPGNFECYICFRVRAPDHFDMLQPQSAYLDRHGRVVQDREPNPHTDRLVSLRRFCVGCGVKEGLHAPFDCLTTRTGRDLWVCRCRRVWSKPGCLRCPYCKGDCPLRPRRKTATDRIFV